MTELPPPRLLVEMTSEDVGAALATGTDTVVFACGSIEQHGPHLPLLVDSLLGEALSERVGPRLDAIVAPTLRIGCSEHHMAFPGSLTLREDTFKAVLHDYCTSLGRHGFRHILIIPSHGGNFRPVAEFVEGWSAGGADGPHLRAFTDLLRFIELWREVVAEAGGPVGHVGGHADIAESSVVLAVRPDLVRTDAARPGYTGELEDALPLIWERGFGAVTDNGVLGDPRGMSPELGHRLLERLADELAHHLRGGDHP